MFMLLGKDKVPGALMIIAAALFALSQTVALRC
jgi:hypothetical protein